MSAAKRVRPTSPSAADDLEMRIVVITLRTAIDSLAKAAQAREHNRPEVARHLQALSEQVAGVTIEALRTWPTSSD